MHRGCFIGENTSHIAGCIAYYYGHTLFDNTGLLGCYLCFCMAQKGSMVVVVGDNDIAEMRPVKLGQAYGGDFLVDEGLKPGERIVVEGTNKAQPGQPVSIVQAEEPEAREEGTK